LFWYIIRASIDVLPEIVSELKDSKIEIYVDGGIRSGIDIFKCLALGAKCVFVGRPVLYSIVVDKDEGIVKNTFNFRTTKDVSDT